MRVICPGCGETVSVGTGGRKRLNLDVNLVCDALRDSSTVGQAAEKLGCSRGYIYKVLNAHGLTVREVLATKQKVVLL